MDSDERIIHRGLLEKKEKRKEEKKRQLQGLIDKGAKHFVHKKTIDLKGIEIEDNENY